MVAICVTGSAGSRLAPLREATLVEGRGIEGDRYFAGEGTFDGRRSGTDVTLIEEEAIEATRRDHGLEIEAWDPRRNIVTRGVRLNDLVGRELRVGDAVVRGVRLCHPCGHLEELTRPGMQAALRGRGGLRADIVRGPLP